MDKDKRSIYIKNIFINIAIAYFIIHPYSMVIFRYFEHPTNIPMPSAMPGTAAPHGSETATDKNHGVFGHLMHSFSLEMLPMSASYIFLGALIGFILAKREYELVIEKNKLEEANKELDRLNKMKDEFLAVCSHDLKAPLSGVYLCMQYIQLKMDLDEKQKKYVDTGISHLMVMEKFINEILHISKIESGKEVLHVEKIDSHEFADEIVNSMNDYAASRNIRLIIFKPASNAVFKADKLKLLRIFNNLISNALKFAVGSVQVEIREETGKMIFSVSDDGPGISSEDQERIFDKFEQAKQKNLIDLNNHGTGLGLAIVKNLAELHNGRVYVKSNSGAGARFTVELPRI